MIVNPDLYEKYRVVINRDRFLRMDGVLQNQDHSISIKASHVQPVAITSAEMQSHDFHYRLPTELTLSSTIPDIIN